MQIATIAARSIAGALFCAAMCLPLACTTILGDFEVSDADFGPGGPALNGVTQVSAGQRHTCALREDRTVVCWGANDKGQLGVDKATGISTKPVVVEGLTNVKQVAAGFRHTCALDQGGTVSCWGENDCGQLGIGRRDNEIHDRPAPVTGRGGAGIRLSDVASISAGEGYTCAVGANGDLACWGCNNFQQLGLPAVGQSTSPVDVPGISGAKAADTGSTHTCAIATVSGELRAQCWGQETAGQLGDNRPSNSTASPVTVQFASGVVPAAPTSLALGVDHTCMLDAAGHVFCWGDNSAGECGTRSIAGPGAKVLQGVPIQELTQTRAIGAGGQFTCGMSADGRVGCLGKNDRGQLGRGNGPDPAPHPNLAPVQGISGASALAVGFAHACAVVRGQVRCWGANDAGQLGNGARRDTNQPVPVLAP